ncbi:hypothetical protein BKA66DRAFT_593253 [Pyrenochaeta sp. MPI-SDFR-AT-0127]|nr:hypothetical protein BKA66DRAFT_593253 [Pyrenochaeta sp. MPI-SDFR-AT-0127]
MTPYQAWYGEKPDLSRLRVIGSKGEYLVSPKQRKKLTEPRTRPCILIGYEGNTNYRILLEDAPSTQTLEDVGAKQYGLPEATAAAAGGSVTVGLLNQPSVSIRQASVPASGRHTSLGPRAQTTSRPSNDISEERVLSQSRNNISQAISQPSNDISEERALSQSRNNILQPVAEEGDRTLSPLRSDDIFGPFSDGPQDDESPSSGDRQRDNARLDQDMEERQRYPEHQLSRPTYEVRQDILERHPELRIRASQATQDTSDESDEELALMNVPEGNVIPTFLTVAAKETEPFEPKTLNQAKNDISWSKWEKLMLEEVNSLK